MRKRAVKHDEAFENFVNEMHEMTDEEFNERNQRIANAIRFHMSDKEKLHFAKRLLKSLKFLTKQDKKRTGKEKKAAKRAKALSKKMIKEASKV